MASRGLPQCGAAGFDHLAQFPRGPGFDVAAGAFELGEDLFGGGQAVARVVAFGAEPVEHLLETGGEIEVASAEVSLAGRVVVVENGEPLLGVGFFSEVEPAAGPAGGHFDTLGDGDGDGDGPVGAGLGGGHEDGVGCPVALWFVE